MGTLQLSDAVWGPGPPPGPCRPHTERAWVGGQYTCRQRPAGEPGSGSSAVGDGRPAGGAQVDHPGCVGKAKGIGHGR